MPASARTLRRAGDSPAAEEGSPNLLGMSTTAERVSAPAPRVAAPASVTRWSVLELVPPLAVVLLGTVLLLPGHGLWFDELFTAAVVGALLAWWWLAVPFWKRARNEQDDPEH